MGTLKGQNFRIFVADMPVAGSTSCTVTLTGNTESASTKNDMDGADKPEITSKGWSVQVESLCVLIMPMLLSAAKAMQPLRVVWDETTGQGNETPIKAAYGRQGFAFINDLNFSFNDRANATMSAQASGTGKLEKIASSFNPNGSQEFAFTKGQYVRLFLTKEELGEFRVIAASRNLSFHLSISLETSTTKDTVDDWIVQDATGYSYDISTSALVRSGEVISSTKEALSFNDLEEMYEASKPVSFEIANVNGQNNRDEASTIVLGEVVITQLAVSAGNKQAVSYDAQLQGYGELFVEE